MNKKLHSVMKVTALAFATVWSGSSIAALISGGDFLGASLTVNNGDILSGSFLNVGSFTIPFGVTVYISDATPLSISAQNILIDGILDGSGRGYAGGSNNNLSYDGLAGSGPGGGAGGLYGPNVHASGGAGGGAVAQGGNGGSSWLYPPSSMGGAANTDPMGSGGGSAGDQACCNPGTGGTGGAGGGAISLLALNTLALNGSILAEGQNGFQGVAGDYPAAGGGGGAGGTISLMGTLLLDGTLNVSGGDGADFNGSALNGSAWGNGGGGGSGGRIILDGLARFGVAYQFNIDGGKAGQSLNIDANVQRAEAVAATTGGQGRYLNNTAPLGNSIPEPGSLALLGLGMTGLAFVRRRKAAR